VKRWGDKSAFRVIKECMLFGKATAMSLSGHIECETAFYSLTCLGAIVIPTHSLPIILIALLLHSNADVDILSSRDRRYDYIQI
jgi:hypothetical protein